MATRKKRARVPATTLAPNSRVDELIATWKSRSTRTPAYAITDALVEDVSKGLGLHMAASRLGVSRRRVDKWVAQCNDYTDALEDGKAALTHEEERQALYFNLQLRAAAGNYHLYLVKELHLPGSTWKKWISILAARDPKVWRSVSQLKLQDKEVVGVVEDSFEPTEEFL